MARKKQQQPAEPHSTKLDDGLYLDRFADGHVRLIRTSGPHTSEGGGTVAKISLTAEQWATATGAKAKPPAIERGESKS